MSPLRISVLSAVGGAIVLWLAMLMYSHFAYVTAVDLNWFGDEKACTVPGFEPAGMKFDLESTHHARWWRRGHFQDIAEVCDASVLTYDADIVLVRVWPDLTLISTTEHRR